MTKEQRLKETIKAIMYIANVDKETALGYAGVFEAISDKWSKSELKELKLKFDKSIELSDSQRELIDIQRKTLAHYTEKLEKHKCSFDIKTHIDSLGLCKCGNMGVLCEPIKS